MAATGGDGGVDEVEHVVVEDTGPSSVAPSALSTNAPAVAAATTTGRSPIAESDRADAIAASAARPTMPAAVPIERHRRPACRA